LAVVFLAVDFLAVDFVAGAFFAAVDFAAGAFFAVVDFEAVDFAVAFFAVVDFEAVDFDAVDFAAGAFFAVVDFEAVDFEAVDFDAVDFAGAFFAVVDFDAVDFAGAFFAVVDFAAVDFDAVALLAGVAFLAAPAAAFATSEALGSLGSFLLPDTNALSSAPAVNFGTAVFLALILSPVRGLRTHRASRTRFSNEPKPVIATFSPLATSRVMVSRTDSRACWACLRLPS
jgi:uncharacterized protein YjbI with pentapeptide repeats